MDNYQLELAQTKTAMAQVAAKIAALEAVLFGEKQCPPDANPNAFRYFQTIPAEQLTGQHTSLTGYITSLNNTRNLLIERTHLEKRACCASSIVRTHVEGWRSLLQAEATGHWDPEDVVFLFGYPHCFSEQQRRAFIEDLKSIAAAKTPEVRGILSQIILFRRSPAPIDAS